MNVLVTGGAGYIGSHTVRELVRRKHRVVVLDNLSRGHGPAVSGARLVRGDICDRELLGELLAREKIEAVLHFAASSLVGESVRFPSEYYNNNVVKGLSLFDHWPGPGAAWFSSTAAVYGEPREIPIPEERHGPDKSYGATKLALEGLCAGTARHTVCAGSPCATLTRPAPIPRGTSGRIMIPRLT